MYGNPYYNTQTRFQNVGSQTLPATNYVQTMQPTVPQTVPMQPINSQIGLLGKSVDSIEVVKAMDIPLDGSISYFPLTDGSAILTKRLQSDGTSKTVIYKPIEETRENTPNFVTFADLEEAIGSIDIGDTAELKEEIRQLKQQIKELKETKDKKK